MRLASQRSVASALDVARSSRDRGSSPRRGRLPRRHFAARTSESCGSLLAFSGANVCQALLATRATDPARVRLPRSPELLHPRLSAGKNNEPCLSAPTRWMVSKGSGMAKTVATLRHVGKRIWAQRPLLAIRRDPSSSPSAAVAATEEWSRICDLRRGLSGARLRRKSARRLQARDAHFDSVCR